MSGILLRLRGNWPWIICHQNNHASLDTNILQAHKRICCHIQAYLLHGNHSSGSRIGCSGTYLHSGFFIYRPFHIGIFLSVFGYCFQNLCRGCTWIASYQPYPCRQGSQSNSLIAHQKFLMHCLSPILLI